MICTTEGVSGNFVAADFRKMRTDRFCLGGGPVGGAIPMIRKHILLGGDMDRFLVDCQPAQDRGFAAQEAYANVASQFGTRKLIYEIIRCDIAI